MDAADAHGSGELSEPAGRTPGQRERVAHLGDFTLTPRVLTISAWAVVVGAAGAVAAFGLLRLIGLLTNLVFAQRVSTALVAPGAAHPGPLLILFAPIGGGLLVGLMARFGSEKIRGHGMPEAIEAILTRGSRVEPRVAILKPISAAISIGSGGPFGAEGPIIMTGGAVGSILAQSLHLTAGERRALLVTGAAAGMTATFNAPLASILLAVELLLFEFRPRSFIPVVCGVVTSTLLRGLLLGHHALFAMSLAHLHLTASDQLLCVVTGAVGGLLAVAATGLVYASEDAFGRLPLHWMWWPAIGGLIIGLGGLVEPQALGVGYNVIDELLTGRAGLSLILGILVVKTLIWSLSLGSGTSGGVLAPVFMIGGALGALESQILPHVVPGFWALAGLAAVVGGVMRSPLTGVIFPLELTHAWPLGLALLIASTAAYTVSALILKRSVLTEKIARRGLHISREYAVDPLEVLLVDEVMSPRPTTGLGGEPLTALRDRADLQRQWLYPVVDGEGALIGVIPRSRLSDLNGDGHEPAAAIAAPARLTTYPDATLRELARRFADAHVTTAIVVSREAPEAVVGVVTVEDLLTAHLRDLVHERHRERILTPRGLPRALWR
ncbi:MAG TPA: chloride channel protein [Solirubrobacteraceae bacterium]|nr:chloride channel protein [Solirubrobacteraceae bacterium]